MRATARTLSRRGSGQRTPRHVTLVIMATVVAFHAHPDDEVLMTGGTLAKLAAQGHRVVIVVACDGAMQEPNSRLDEFRASAAILGAARAEHLGYADSGHGPVLYPDPPGRARFARADPAEAASKLAALLQEEQADLLLSYDPVGGYGHRDHIKVHDVGARAAELADVRVIEATVPRELAVRAISVLRRLGLVSRYTVAEARSAGTPRAAITHRVNVRRYAARKQAALAAHRSPVSGQGRLSRLFRLAVSLPSPVFGLFAGREWFTEPAAAPGTVLDDILRSRSG
jgi:LmbE family N-acetylglucosaminyl deacetylase